MIFPKVEEDEEIVFLTFDDIEFNHGLALRSGGLSGLIPTVLGGDSGLCGRGLR